MTGSCVCLGPIYQHFCTITTKNVHQFPAGYHVDLYMHVIAAHILTACRLLSTARWQWTLRTMPHPSVLTSLTQSLAGVREPPSPRSSHLLMSLRCALDSSNSIRSIGVCVETRCYCTSFGAWKCCYPPLDMQTCAKAAITAGLIQSRC